MKRQRHVLIAGIAAAVLLIGCSEPNSVESSIDPSDPTEKLPAKYKTQETVEKPDFSEAARSPLFQEAIKEASTLFGTKPQPLFSPSERVEVAGGVGFDVPAGKLEAILLEAHKRFLAKGFYLFRIEQHFGFGEKPDKVGLLPTADKYAVMAAMETNGDNYSIGTSGVIAWMKDLEMNHPFVLTGIGFDYMEGHFSVPVTNAQDLAQRMYEFCPDIVEQGVGTKAQLAAEIEKGNLYFWWD